MSVTTNFRYKCDKCGKTLDTISEDQMYQAGWHKLDEWVMTIGKVVTHRINSQENFISERDKNFCSVVCTMAFIEAKVLEQPPTTRNEPSSGVAFTSPRQPQPLNNPTPRKDNDDDLFV